VPCTEGNRRPLQGLSVPSGASNSRKSAAAFGPVWEELAQGESQRIFEISASASGLGPIRHEKADGAQRVRDKPDASYARASARADAKSDCDVCLHVGAGARILNVGSALHESATSGDIHKSKIQYW